MGQPNSERIDETNDRYRSDFNNTFTKISTLFNMLSSATHMECQNAWFETFGFIYRIMKRIAEENKMHFAKTANIIIIKPFNEISKIYPNSGSALTPKQCDNICLKLKLANKKSPPEIKKYFLLHKCDILSIENFDSEKFDLQNLYNNDNMTYKCKMIGSVCHFNYVSYVSFLPELTNSETTSTFATDNLANNLRSLKLHLQNCREKLSDFKDNKNRFAQTCKSMQGNLDDMVEIIDLMASPEGYFLNGKFDGYLSDFRSKTKKIGICYKDYMEHHDRVSKIIRVLERNKFAKKISTLTQVYKDTFPLYRIKREDLVSSNFDIENFTNS